MPTLEETREQLCHAIASLDVHASLHDVSEAFAAILESVREHATIDLDSDGVTPLMVACDKDQQACIEWILKKNMDEPSLASLLGSPLDRTEYGNTALHFAANAGCFEAMRLFRATMDDEETSPTMRLASLRNENYDTPIMIAAMKGNVAFLRQIMRLLEIEDAATGKEVFELVNDNGDTALSLACGHGHVEVVNFLLQEARATFTYEHAKDAEQTLQQIDDALECAPTTPDEHRARRNDVHRCLVILKVALVKSAQANMEQLLAEEEEEKAKKQGKDMAKKKSRRKAKRRGMPDDGGNISSTSGTIALEYCRSKNERDSKEDRKAEIGSDVLNENDQELAEKSHQALIAPEDTMDAPAEATGPSSLPAKARQIRVDTDLDVDAIIEALCLDASMLLLNPREMALNLSPCQLDAVAAVLRNQIQAVKEAQIIQASLRDQPNKS